jgi:hypothetical protein
MIDRGDNPGDSEARSKAWQLFEAGDFADALDAFLALHVRGAVGEPERDALVELLIDRGDVERALDVLDQGIARGEQDAGKLERIGLLARRFGLATEFSVDAARRREAGLSLLETLAASENARLWAEYLTAARLEGVDQAFPLPTDLLDALEQLAYAPAETGFPEQARARIEAIGLQRAEDAAVSRSAEQLLHALGDATAGYRIEQARKAAALRQTPASRAKQEAKPLATAELTGLRVALAGGHPGLRAVIQRDLARSGVAEVRSIPSAKEASRAGRDVKSVVAGSDVVVLLVRQLAHSTVAQIRRAAEQTGVAVVVADSAGIGGVHRALVRFTTERGGA